jgi:hypothetical protein
MRQWILLAVIGLTLSCVVGTVLALGRLQGSLSIHAIPVYPGATNVQVQEWGAPSGSQSQVVIYGQSGSGQASGLARSFIQSMYKRTPGGGTIDFSTNDSPQQLYAFYDSQLGRAGWTSSSPPPVSTALNSTSGQTSRIYMYGSYGSTGLPWLSFLPSIHATVIVRAFQYQVGSSNQVSVVLIKW